MSKSSFKLLTRKDLERVMRKSVQSEESVLLKRVPGKELGILESKTVLNLNDICLYKMEQRSATNLKGCRINALLTFN